MVILTGRSQRRDDTQCEPVFREHIMTTIETLKSQAKRLRTHLSANNIPLSHSQTLEAVAVMHGHRDWNTVSAAMSKVPALQQEREPLMVYVTPDTSAAKLRGDVENLLRRAPMVLRFRLDTGIALEQARFARSVATEVEHAGVKVEFDSPL